MYSYKDMKCSACNVQFTENDDVVVCPICGAPHHRECYSSLGHCSFNDTHGTDEQWSRPQAEEAATEETNTADSLDNAADSAESNNGTTECPRCKTQNDSSMNFCTKCGYPLNPNINSNTYSPNGRSFNQPNVAVMFDPYGGVDPKSEIEDIPVADIAAFIGNNSGYYIPRFMEMSKSKRKNYFNFTAFLFGYLWFGYRKMNLNSLLIGIISLVLSSFYTIASLTPDMAAQLGQDYGIQISSYTFPSYVIFVLWLLLFVMRTVVFIFGNRLYMKYVINKVKKYSEEYKGIDELQYQKALTRHGGVSFAISIAAIGLYYLASSLIIAFFIM